MPAQFFMCLYSFSLTAYHCLFFFPLWWNWPSQNSLWTVFPHMSEDTQTQTEIEIKDQCLERGSVKQSWSPPCTRLFCSLKPAQKTGLSGRLHWVKESVGSSCQPKCIWAPVQIYLSNCGGGIADQWTTRNDKCAESITAVFIFSPAGTDSCHLHLLCLHAVLQLKLQQRRTREELVSQGIMPRKCHIYVHMVLLRLQQELHI